MSSCGDGLGLGLADHIGEVQGHLAQTCPNRHISSEQQIHICEDHFSDATRARYHTCSLERDRNILQGYLSHLNALLCYRFSRHNRHTHER